MARDQVKKDRAYELMMKAAVAFVRLRDAQGAGVQWWMPRARARC